MRWQSITMQERRQRRKLELRKRMESWHKCFAWLPVRLADNKNEVRWLEYVYRKGELMGRDGGMFCGTDCYKWQYADSILGILKVSE